MKTNENAFRAESNKQTNNQSQHSSLLSVNVCVNASERSRARAHIHWRSYHRKAIFRKLTRNLWFVVCVVIAVNSPFWQNYFHNWYWELKWNARVTSSWATRKKAKKKTKRREEKNNAKWKFVCCCEFEEKSPENIHSDLIRLSKTESLKSHTKIFSKEFNWSQPTRWPYEC